MILYDPNIIHRHAKSLYDRAQRITIVYGLGFGLLGLFGGAGLGSTLGDLGGGLAFFFAGLLAALGALVGHARGFELRLQAQLALCQVQIELNGRVQTSTTSYAAPAQGR